MRVNRVARKQAADQNHLRRKQVQAPRDDLDELTQTARAVFDDFHDLRIAARRCFENDRRKPGNFHLVGGLRPADELVEIAERERVQNFRCEL